MQVQLKPELARFIEDQVKSGRYGSPEDAVNAAVAKLQSEEELLADELDDEDLARIEEGLVQAGRGETRPWAEVREELRAKYLKP